VSLKSRCISNVEFVANGEYFLTIGGHPGYNAALWSIAGIKGEMKNKSPKYIPLIEQNVGKYEIYQVKYVLEKSLDGCLIHIF
jgi:hypothetical protein